MAHSKHFEFDAATEPPGRDDELLGPGDSSDSGSDVIGLDDEITPVDPGLPVDIALRREPRKLSGARERREAPDIAPDHVIGRADEEGENEEPDLAAIELAEAPDPLEDEAAEDDESGVTSPSRSTAPKPVAAAAAPPPGKPNPEPDVPDTPDTPDPNDPEPIAPDNERDIPDEDGPARRRR
jgi:hypothetical protein